MQLQAETGSDAAAAEAHASALAAAHKDLEDTMQQLRSDLQAATAAFAAGQERCQQLDEQLAAVSAELQQEQADKQALLLQLQQGRDELAALQAQHDQLLNSSGSEAAAASAELQELRISMQQLQAAHVTLQEEHAAAAAAAAAAQEQQRLLQQQLGDAQQQLSELQTSHAALQAEHALQGQQLQEAQRALKVLQESQGQQAAELSTAQQQLAALQDTHAAALRQQQQLESERQQLSMQQQSLQAGLTSSQAEVAAMQAAAKAAEEKRLSQPHKSTQVSAADHAGAHWVSGRGVQTGAELDPKATRDVGTPADLGLLSYFFREIKQKQRGGGGAILGYDPADAAKAAEGMLATHTTLLPAVCLLLVCQLCCIEACSRADGIAVLPKLQALPRLVNVSVWFAARSVVQYCQGTEQGAVYMWFGSPGCMCTTLAEASCFFVFWSLPQVPTVSQPSHGLAVLVCRPFLPARQAGGKARAPRLGRHPLTF